MVQERPSKGEIIKKISEAIKAIEEEKRAIPNSKHFLSDQEDLEVEDTSNLWFLLIVFLKEIEALGPNDHYAGSRPPQKSYEVEVKGKELWAYSWFSVSRNKDMYIKFCLIKGHYFYMGCHVDRPQEN